MEFVCSKNMDAQAQIQVLINYLSENLGDSLPDSTKIDFSEHHASLEKLVKKQDYIGVLNHLLGLKK